MEQLELKEILRIIKVNGDLSYLHELLDNKQVKGIIHGVVKKYKYNCKDVKNIAQSYIQDFTLKYYEYMEEYTEERYINFIRKYLGRKIRETVFKMYPVEELSFSDIEEIEDLSEDYVERDFSDDLIDKIDLENVLKKLNEIEQLIMRKYYFEGYSDKEIGEEVGVSQQNINQRRHRILIKIKKYLIIE